MDRESRTLSRVPRFGSLGWLKSDEILADPDG